MESGVIAEGSVSGVMEGWKYNRAVRLHKLVLEALLRLTLTGFQSWLEARHVKDMVHLDKALEAIDFVAKEISHADFEQILNNPSSTRILDLFDDYAEVLRL